MANRQLMLALTASAVLLLAGLGAAFTYSKLKAKNLKCKGQVCANVFNNGAIDTVGNVNVVTVSHSTGDYCIELSPKVDAASVDQVLLTPTAQGGGQLVSAQWVYGKCGTNGIQVKVYNRDGASVVAADQGFSLLVP
jgi:hypothetical protein